MIPVDLSKRIASTYFYLRMGMGIIALVFPVLLWIGGRVGANLPLQGSMSAYYHAEQGYMRDWFVGILFAIGIMLFLYKGFTRIEDYVLNVAGVLALGIALFPMAWPESGKPPYYGTIHGSCAIFFFLCIAYVCIFHGDDTLDLLEQNRGQKAIQKYRRTYKILGSLMIISPLIAAGASTFFGFSSFSFFVETVGVWVFAAYWLVKTREEFWTGADEKAAKGELEVVKTADGPWDVEPKSVPPKESQVLDEISIPDQMLGKVSVQEKSTSTL